MVYKFGIYHAQLLCKIMDLAINSYREGSLMKRQKQSPLGTSAFRIWEKRGMACEVRELRDHGGLEAR